MKTIRLTAQQRHEIKGRRRHAQDRRIDQRLSAALGIDAGRTREEVAEPSGASTRPVGQWLRIFRNKGRDALGTWHDRGDPGRLRPAQVERLKQPIARGASHNADRVRAGIEPQFGATYPAAGVKDLLHRIGAGYHEVSGFFGEADRDEPRAFVRESRRQRREAGPATRRYFVGAGHPVWGLELLSCCRLPVGPRSDVGVGGGRERLNILGAYCPDDHDSVDLRLTQEDITGEPFVQLLEEMLAKHPEAEEFLLYLDDARYYSEPVVKGWLSRPRQSHLVSWPAYSPNLDLIERLWESLRETAPDRGHETFEAMQEAVGEVLGHRDRSRWEGDSLMTEEFHILKDEELPFAPAA